MKKLILALLLVSVSGHAAQMEKLLGYVYDRDGIVIQVFSGGCTYKEDFTVVKKEQGKIVGLGFYRNRHDSCLALYPYGEFVQFSYEELGISAKQNFLILNSVSAVRGKN